MNEPATQVPTTADLAQRLRKLIEKAAEKNVERAIVEYDRGIDEGEAKGSG